MIVDVALVRRVEGTAARWQSRQVDALEAYNPQGGATACDLDGGVLVAMGAGRYVNRGVGLGLGGTAPVELLDELEAFYNGLGLAPMLEASPWMSVELVGEMRSRGYTVEWFRNVYARTLEHLPAPRREVPIEMVDDDCVDEWASILGAETDPGSPARAVSDEFCHALYGSPGSIQLVARNEGRAIACGSMTIVQGVAWLGGAATLPNQRGRGAQHALLINRLHRARRDGCGMAAVTAVPGGASARNLERVGFQLLYTQAVMTRAQ